MPDRAADSESTIVDRLKHLVTEELDVALPASDITASTPLFEGGMGLDSFAIVELITLIEKAFGFEFPEADLRPEVFVNLETLASAVLANVRTDSRAG